MNIVDISNNKYKQYSLNENNFDPSKFSPPNCFIHKLNFRIHNMSFNEGTINNNLNKSTFLSVFKEEKKDEKKQLEEQNILIFEIDNIFSLENL